MATQGEAAAHVGIDRRTFVNLIDAGHVIRQPENGYDLSEVARQVVAHYKNKVVADLNAAKTGLADAQRKKTELEIAEREGRLIPIEIVEETWASIVTTIRTRLVSIPSRVASRLGVIAAKPEKAEAFLRELIDEALASLSGATLVHRDPPKRRSARRSTADAGAAETAAEAAPQ